MDLSIVILNYKSKNMVRECLAGIRMAAPALKYEIIVVDNGSGDGVGKTLSENFPEVKFIASPENVGFAAGNNLGIRASIGRYILIMNPDIAVFAGSVEALVRYMDENKEVGLAGPKLLNPDRTVQDSVYRFPRKMTPVYRRTPFGKTPTGKQEIQRYLMKDWNHEGEAEVDWLLGACLMIRREAMEQVGLLDERFFLYFEDTDWCRRFWEKGWKVSYVPESTMVHFHRRESAESPLLSSLFKKTTQAHIRSGVKYFLKYRGKNNPRTIDH
ncbi:glycosyltransferase family 2 protein [Candidatus Uhrbacteria bacterium]|nr:glycosyltransferase family 2 protein [Candidatus Uhrbacteria bacterium]